MEGMMSDEAAARHAQACRAETHGKDDTRLPSGKGSSSGGASSQQMSLLAGRKAAVNKTPDGRAGW